MTQNLQLTQCGSSHSYQGEWNPVSFSWNFSAIFSAFWWHVIICILLLQLRFPSKHSLFHCLSLPKSKCIHLVLLLLIGLFDLQLPASITNSAFCGEHVEDWGIKRKSWFHLLAINIRLFMLVIDCAFFHLLINYKGLF